MAGGGVGGSRGNGVAAPASIPVAARKMVQSLKEIVNCTEPEIYAMLKECGMDPDEAVNRLLSQDTFHEVKSKREKKKEIKETPESRSRAVNSSSSRVSRIGVDRGGRSLSTQFSSNDYGVIRGKPASTKENGTNTAPTSSILGPSMAGNNPIRRSTGLSESASTECTIQLTGIDDGISSSLQPSSGFQHNCMSKPGHVSMADIVKMGRPQGKASSTSFVPSDMPYTLHNGIMPSMSQQSATRPPTTILPSETDQEFHYSQDPISEVADISHDLGTAIGQHISHNDWSLVEESPAISGSTVPETSCAPASYSDPSASSTLPVGEVDLQLNPHLEEIRVLEGKVNGENLPAESVRSASVTDRQILIDNPEDDFQVDDVPLKNVSSYQSQRHGYDNEEAEDIDAETSTAAASLQKLRLHNEELAAKSAGDNPAVIIPSHLQVTADCSHLSFGSFGSGMSAAFAGSYASKPHQTNLEVAPVADDSSSLNQSDARNLEYYDNGQLHSSPNDNVASRTVENPGDYDIPSASPPEIIRNDSLDAAHGLQYNLPSVSGYAFSTSTQPNTAAYPYPQANQQIQNLTPFSSLMQPYTNSLPSSLLTQSVQPLREFDLPFSPLHTTQSPTKFGTAMPTVSGPTISSPEAKPGVYSNPQPTPQTLPSTSIPAGPGLPQHLPIHPYSQHTLPLGHFANLISYPFVPQSYTYLPSAAFQQAYTGNGPFHQSPAAVHNAGIQYTLPQYKSSVSVTSLPQSAAVASGYGGFGSSSNIPGSFSLNPSTAAASTTLGFDEALSMQFKEGNHYAPHQQTENSAMWVHGTGSRTVSTLPSSSFYSFQGQNQHSGYRQGQQPSHFGAMGYANLYRSQAGASQEHQNPNEGNLSGSNLSGSQSLPSQQSHQLWQHGY